MSRLIRRHRYTGEHRPGVVRPLPAWPPAQDPFAQAEAFDPMTDTALIQVGGVW